MRTIIRELGKKKNLDQNLRLYADKMGEIYSGYSMVRLAMNYYSLCEQYREDVMTYASIDGLTIFHSILKEVILNRQASAEEKEEAKNTLFAIRDSIIDTMKVATAYTDIFYIYEYVLNRMEYRYKEAYLPFDYSDEEFTREIMRYIVADEDAAVMNRKICDVLGQLPLRLTKQKFFEYVSNGLSVYKTTDQASLDDFLYRVRTSAMLDRPASFEDELTELFEVHQALQEADYANMDKEKFDELYDMLHEATNYLHLLTDAYVAVEELINDGLVVLLADDTSMYEDKAIECCEKILTLVHGYFAQDDADMTEVEDLFVFLEGAQEAYMESIQSDSYIADEWYFTKTELLKEYNLLENYAALNQMNLLTSGSVFAELDTERTQVAITEGYLNDKKDILFNDLTVLFKEQPRVVNRAVMSTVLAQLPVFFQNISEMQDFIYLCLTQCRDEAEKLACVEILNGVISESDD